MPDDEVQESLDDIIRAYFTGVLKHILSDEPAGLLRGSPGKARKWKYDNGKVAFEIRPGFLNRNFFWFNRMPEEFKYAFCRFFRQCIFDHVIVFKAAKLRINCSNP